MKRNSRQRRQAARKAMSRMIQRALYEASLQTDPHEYPFDPDWMVPSNVVFISTPKTADHNWIHHEPGRPMQEVETKGEK